MKLKLTFRLLCLCFVKAGIFLAVAAPQKQNKKKTHSHTQCYYNVLDAAAEEAMELDEDDLIEIAEEADLIQAERIVEDNFGPRGGRDGRKRGEEAVREVEELMLAMNLDKAEIQAEQSEEGWEVNMFHTEIRKSLT